MPISVEWENADQTILRWTLSGAWTWDEYRQAQAVSHSLMRSVSHKVDIVADMRDAPTLPRDAFNSFRRYEVDLPPNRDRIVLVTNSVFVRSMAAAFNQVFRSQHVKFDLADSIEEAHILLAGSRVV